MSELAETARLDAAIFDRPWPAESWQHEFDSPSTSVWLADSVGFICCTELEEREAEIRRLGVAEDQRRSGFGRHLLGVALDELRRKGIEKAYLEVGEDNQPAVDFYLNSGFNTFSVRKGYYNRGEDALCMRLYLN